MIWSISIGTLLIISAIIWHLIAISELKERIAKIQREQIAKLQTITPKPYDMVLLDDEVRVTAPTADRWANILEVAADNAAFKSQSTICHVGGVKIHVLTERDFDLLRQSKKED